MRAERLVQQAAADGVRLSLDPSGGIRYVGNEPAVKRWLSIIRENKPGIVVALQEAANDTSAQPAQERREDSERIAKVVATIEVDPALRYAMDVRAELDPEDVIVSLAIRGKGACEVRIPKSRYDAFRLMEAIERHTGSRMLQ